MNQAKPLKDLLAHQAGLESLFHAARHLSKLNQLIKSYLPANLSEHSQVINYIRGKLVIGVSNASLATQLRFQLPTLLSQLRAHSEFAGITQIVEKALPPTDPVLARPPRKIRTLGSLARESLESLLHHTNDESLKKRLGHFLDQEVNLAPKETFTGKTMSCDFKNPAGNSKT